MSSDNHWFSFTKKIYYTLGAAFYIYKWIGLTGVVGLIGTPFLYHFFPSPLLSSYLVPISLAATLLGFNYWKRTNTNRLASPNPNFKIISEDYKYILLDDNKYRCEIRIKAKALQHGVDHYVHKFFWTGDGDIDAFVEDNRLNVVLSDTLHHDKKVCTVYFDRQLRKSEQVNLAFGLEMEDIGAKAKPFHARTIYYPLDKLVLRVQFPHNNNHVYKKQIFSSDIAEIPINEIEVVSNSKENHWDIPHPRLNHRYKITWK